MNITFDLETLGTTYNAPIVQIAAIKFEDDGTIIDEFIESINLESLNDYNFEPTYSTISWWLNQDTSAIYNVFSEDNERKPIKDVLGNFIKWLGEDSKVATFWSHCTFDPPILDNAFKQVDFKNPIPYKNHSDLRTLKSLGGEIDIPKTGTHHYALDDCKYQVNYVATYLKLLKV